MRTIALVIALGVLFVAAIGVASAAPLADAANGKVLWEKSRCAKCHGDKGQGAFAGPRAGDTRTAEQWITQVRTPRANMPASTVAQASDQDLRDMNEYMKTLSAVTGFTPPASPVKAGDPPGKALIFQKRCIACHGENGPLVNFTGSNRTPTAESVLAQLRKPKANMPMYSASQVSDEQAGQIAEFLAAQITAAVLPKTGEPAPILALAGIGAALAAGGLALRRRAG